jgi:putative ATP-dependent endonuclease of OLD family
VGGTNFTPYAKFLTALGIPFSIVTDWDPMASGKALGMNRAAELVGIIEGVKTGKSAAALTKELKAIGEKNTLEEFDVRCADYGVFTNSYTLEVDLFKYNMAAQIIETLRESELSPERNEWVDSWEVDPEKIDETKYLKIIESIGKGRFSQRLSLRAEGVEPLRYLRDAIIFVADRV